LNLLLLALVAGLGWLVFRAGEPVPGPLPEPLTELREDGVTSFVVEHPGEREALQLLRRDGRWWLRRDGRPLLVADPLRVSRVLSLVEAHSMVSYPLAGRTLRDFGLDPPRLSVTVDGVTLRVGDQDSLNYRRYVAVGERLHLVTDTEYVHLSAPWITFVDPAPLAAATPLTAIETAAWRVGRYAGGPWQPGADDSVDAPAVAVVWQQLRASEIVVGESLSGSEVRLQFVDGSERRLWVAQVADGLQLTWPEAGITYRVEGVSLQQLGLGG